MNQTASLIIQKELNYFYEKNNGEVLVAHAIDTEAPL